MEKNKNVNVWKIATMVILGISIVLVMINRYMFETKVKPVFSEAGALLAENNKLKSYLEQTLGSQSKLSLKEIEELKSKGLKYPITEIIFDLMQHKELIPSNGTLGGTMNFYSPKNISIVSSKHVKANFEDGHNLGNMVLEYKVSDGKISWKVISSHMD